MFKDAAWLGSVASVLDGLAVDSWYTNYTSTSNGEVYNLCIVDEMSGKKGWSIEIIYTYHMHSICNYIIIYVAYSDMWQVTRWPFYTADSIRKMKSRSVTLTFWTYINATHTPESCYLEQHWILRILEDPIAFFWPAPLWHAPPCVLKFVQESKTKISCSACASMRLKDFNSSSSPCEVESNGTKHYT